MKKSIVIVVILTAIGAAFALRFQALARPRTAASIAAVQAAEGKPVEVVTAERGDIETWLALAGTVEGAVQYAVESGNALRVVAIPVAEGARVRAGEVVMRLAPEAPTPMVHSYGRAKATWEQALSDAQRLRSLHAEGAISDQALDQAETRLRVAAADLQDAEDGISLVAATNGVVVSILVDEGETVEAGKPLAWIARTDEVKVCFDAGSRQALALALGQPAVWADGDGVDRTGVVSRLGLRADPKTHLLAGEATFANPDGRLLPGLLVSIRVRADAREDVIRVPAGALVDGAAVFVIDGAVARRRDVTLGARTTEFVEVTAGLTGGERVVRFGQRGLSDGERVKIVEG